VAWACFYPVSKTVCYPVPYLCMLAASSLPLHRRIVPLSLLRQVSGSNSVILYCRWLEGQCRLGAMGFLHWKRRRRKLRGRLENLWAQALTCLRGKCKPSTSGSRPFLTGFAISAVFPQKIIGSGWDIMFCSLSQPS
jgi:hypothetical protein